MSRGPEAKTYSSCEGIGHSYRSATTTYHSMLQPITVVRTSRVRLANRDIGAILSTLGKLDALGLKQSSVAAAVGADSVLRVLYL